MYFITHPNVVVSRDVPVPRWPLSELGKQRMRAGLRQPWVREIGAIYCSTEQKAIDGAEILAQHAGLGFTQVEELGENDRSATGFLPPDEFERVADQFFARPHESVRGWERAVDAQSRIVQAVARIPVREETIAIVSHGAVGTLLYCHLAGKPIDRRWDQPPNGGGNFYAFTLAPRAVHSWWRAIDT
jgi:broad specificity phosphatase PhoE